MIGQTVSIFGRAAVRARASNALVRGENAPGTVCIFYNIYFLFVQHIIILYVYVQYFISIYILTSLKVFFYDLKYKVVFENVKV